MFCFGNSGHNDIDFLTVRTRLQLRDLYGLRSSQSVWRAVARMVGNK